MRLTTTISALLTLALLAACTTLEISIETPAVPQSTADFGTAVQGTIIAAATQTAAATGTTATPASTDVPVTAAAENIATVSPQPAQPTATLFTPPTATTAPTNTPLPPPPATAQTPVAPTPTPDIDPTQLAAQPKIIAFDVTPGDRLASGDTVTVNWEWEGFSAVLCISYYGISAYDVTNLGCTDLPASGTQQVTVESETGAYAEFQLYVVGGGDGEEALIYIPFTCSTDWFFASPPEWCPAFEAATIDAVAQRYEHGLLVWLEQLMSPGVRLYAFLDQPDVPFGDFHNVSRYRVYHNPPEATPDPETTNGHTIPDSLFYALWDGQVAGSGDLRDLLGWPTTEPIAYQARYQCAASPAQSDLCYLSGPDGETLALLFDPAVGENNDQVFSGGSWAIWPPP